MLYDENNMDEEPVKFVKCNQIQNYGVWLNDISLVAYK